MTVVPTSGGLRQVIGARTVDEVLWDNHERARFVIEGLIHATTTLVYGLSEAGKSWLMVSMVTSLVNGESWLGQPVNGGPRRCLVLGADAGGAWEYAERLGGGFGDRILLGTPPPPRLDLWQALAQEAVGEGIGVVVVDNLYAWAGSVDMNSNAEVAEPLACLGVVAEAGIAMVLVHHTNSTGRKPAGVHSIPAYFRHCLEVHRDRVRSHGNDAATATYGLGRDGGRVIAGSQALDPRSTDEPGTTRSPGRRRGVQDRYERALAELQKVPHMTSGRAKGEHLATVMPDVGTAEAGRQLVRTMERNGLLPRPGPGQQPGG